MIFNVYYMYTGTHVAWTKATSLTHCEDKITYFAANIPNSESTCSTPNTYNFDYTGVFDVNSATGEVTVASGRTNMKDFNVS